MIWDNILYAVEKLPPKTLTINMNIDKSNLHYQNDLIDIIKEHNIIDQINISKTAIFLEKNRSFCDYSNFQINELDIEDFGSIHCNEIKDINQLEYQPCVARGDFYIIDMNGNLNKCLSLAGRSYNVGNVNDGFTEYNDELLKYVTFEPWNYKPCSMCPAIPLCFGGCMAKRIKNPENEKYCSGKIKDVKTFVLSKIQSMKNQITFDEKDLEFIDMEIVN